MQRRKGAGDPSCVRGEPKPGRYNDRYDVAIVERLQKATALEGGRYKVRNKIKSTGLKTRRYNGQVQRRLTNGST